MWVTKWTKKKGINKSNKIEGTKKRIHEGNKIKKTYLTTTT
jgi:hypothetical protein